MKLTGNNQGFCVINISLIRLMKVKKCGLSKNQKCEHSISLNL